MELFQYSRPDLFAGKKILFVHGFASSGSCGGVATMRLLLPNADVISPDLPVDPVEALDLLKKLCAEEKPDLIVGTSAGGMFTQQLQGFYRILVNPAFHLADTILKNNGLGRQEYHSPRVDGQTSFLVNKALIEQYREVSRGCFTELTTEDDAMVWGLFGMNDTLVNCFDEFASHYHRAIHFDGEHYLNDHTFLHSVLPLIQQIDDIQQGRTKKTVLVALEDTLMDSRNGCAVGTCVKSLSRLSQWYDVYITVSGDYNHPERISEKVSWINEHLGVMAWDRVIATNRKDLLLGDYLVDSRDCETFMGTSVPYGSPQFADWDVVLTFFERLAGQ